ELAALRPQLAEARTLESRIRQLEAEKATVRDRSDGAVPAGVSREEFARVSAAQAEAEDKLATALRSYSLLVQERDELRSRVADLSTKVSTTSDALKTAESEAKSIVASNSASVASSA